jgi:hypothetical protein
LSFSPWRGFSISKSYNVVKKGLLGSKSVKKAALKAAWPTKKFKKVLAGVENLGGVTIINRKARILAAR